MVPVLVAIIPYLFRVYSLCRNPGRHRSPVSSTEWFTEERFVSSHRQSTNTETGRTEPSLPRLNHPKLRVQALEVMGQISKGVLEKKPKLNPHSAITEG